MEAVYFHPDCFCCDKCQKPLTGKFHKQDGQRICEACKGYSYCEACRKRIEGKETRSEGRVWHAECFKCTHCEQPIVGSFCRIDGALTCVACRDALTEKPKPKASPEELPKCRGCKQPIEEDESSILADKRDMFHERCFKCRKCAKALNSYVILEDRKFSYQDCPYFCDSCATAERAAARAVDAERPAAQEAAGAATCAACGGACGANSEEDAFQLLDGRVLHVSCFKCSKCGATPLANGTGTLQMPLLRSKVEALLRGEYLCSACAPDPAPNGYPKEAKSEAKTPPKLEEEPTAPKEVPAPAPAVPAVLPARCGEPMTLEELRDADIWKARGIDASSREQMLSDADFQTAFGVTKEDFGKLAGWKRAQKKRELGLF